MKGESKDEEVVFICCSIGIFAYIEQSVCKRRGAGAVQSGELMSGASTNDLMRGANAEDIVSIDNQAKTITVAPYIYSKFIMDQIQSTDGKEQSYKIYSHQLYQYRIEAEESEETTDYILTTGEGTSVGIDSGVYREFCYFQPSDYVTYTFSSFHKGTYNLEYGCKDYANGRTKITLYGNDQELGTIESAHVTGGKMSPTRESRLAMTA